MFTFSAAERQKACSNACGRQREAKWQASLVLRPKPPLNWTKWKTLQPSKAVGKKVKSKTATALPKWSGGRQGSRVERGMSRCRWERCGAISTSVQVKGSWKKCKPKAAVKMAQNKPKTQTQMQNKSTKHKNCKRDSSSAIGTSRGAGGQGRRISGHVAVYSVQSTARQDAHC